MLCGSGGSKSRLARAAGEEPSGEMRNEKLHATVLRSTFRSQNVKNTSCPDYFWKLRCGKVHAAAFKVKICKTHHVWLTFGELLEVEVLKNCTPLWREAHFEVKSQNVKKNSLSDRFWKLRCSKSTRSCGAKHMSKSKRLKNHTRTTFGRSTAPHNTTLHYNDNQNNNNDNNNYYYYNYNYYYYHHYHNHNHHHHHHNHNHNHNHDDDDEDEDEGDDDDYCYYYCSSSCCCCYNYNYNYSYNYDYHYITKQPTATTTARATTATTTTTTTTTNHNYTTITLHHITLYYKYATRPLPLPLLLHYHYHDH